MTDKVQADRQRPESVRDVMVRKMKELRVSPKVGTDYVDDPYRNALASLDLVRGRTGIIHNLETSAKHKCEWDHNYPEKPKRLEAIIERCEEEKIFSKCHVLPCTPRLDTVENILNVHTKSYYEYMEIRKNFNLEELEFQCRKFDAVYINHDTFDVACAAADCVVNLVEEIALNKLQNGMALVRPPGHHAGDDGPNGYCIFNNVGIAAEFCIRKNLAKRILIVDFDVHHGQGVQHMFYHRKDVLYFSIHRYEYGEFWPNMKESNFNYIGTGAGLGYNINVPLNKSGLSDDDYLSIVFSILLPVAYEFNPQLVLVCAGYDSCMGDEKGQMNVTPGFYHHLMTLLSGLAQGRIAVCLEGGYFLPSLAEGVCSTIKGLLGMPCPPLKPLKTVDPSVVETICDVRRTLYGKWKCFDICEVISPELITGNKYEEATYCINYHSNLQPAPYLTRNCYPVNSALDMIFFQKWTEALKEVYKSFPSLPVAYVYDDKMLEHRPPVGEIERPERPERIESIMAAMEKYKVLERCIKIDVTKRNIELHSLHTYGYLNQADGNLTATADVYFNEKTYEVCRFAVSSLLCMGDAVFENKAGSGIAIIRPPGHHAECDKPMGFCILNNVAFLANYMINNHRMQRILIVDFDIHHGNGTQNMFYNLKEVMYLSIHRDDSGKYFPSGSYRQHVFDGFGCGKGYNVNIPFNKDKMGDTEYLAVFHNIVLPIAYSYAPQLVIVSAGFDAGIHDPLGNYQVHPETFGHFIQMLKPLAGGKLIVVLEGGYNLTTTSYAMAICAKTLLGDPITMPENLFKSFSKEAIDTIRKVMKHFDTYYPCLTINKKLPLVPTLNKKIDSFSALDYERPTSQPLCVDKVDSNIYVERAMYALNETDENTPPI